MVPENSPAAVRSSRLIQIFSPSSNYSPRPLSSSTIGIHYSDDYQLLFISSVYYCCYYYCYCGGGGDGVERNQKIPFSNIFEISQVLT